MVTPSADGYSKVALSLTVRQGTSNGVPVFNTALSRAASPFVCSSPIRYFVKMRNMLVCAVCLVKKCVLFNSQFIVV